MDNTCTVLPDGSAFATASWPLPKDHWLYAPRGEWDSARDEFAECPLPILTNAQRQAVTAAARYAIRGATMCGQDEDFDPDAMVLNMVYALCGPAGGARLMPANARLKGAHPQGLGCKPCEATGMKQMTITRETLELAALAIGGTFSPGTEKVRTGETWDEWEWRGAVGICVGGVVICPHTDIADATRLAVKMRMMVDVTVSCVEVFGGERWSNQRIWHNGTQPDMERAYCHAITLCAAEIGRRMKGGE